MSKFLIRETASGFKFDLLALNGQVILTSEVYTSRAAARKGIASIRLIAPAAPLENLTEPGSPACPNPKFELYQDRAGKYRFRLKARNGKIVGISEGYSSKTGCLNGIDSVRNNANQAETEE
jgi:uncharacterized protein YegP (UPF0339 family)